jgi:lysozyme
MTPSINCIKLVKRSEGDVLKAYPDPGTGGDPWTIGYGHTGPEVHQGMVITQPEAEILLGQDLQRVGQQVAKAVKVELTQNEFDALVCFVFNVGIGNFMKSSMLRLLNAGDYAAAANEFDKWTKAAGHVLPGLVTRRHDEKDLFNASA